MLSTKADIDESVLMGENCTVWQFATICSNATLGNHVVIGSCAWVGKFVTIGTGTRIQHGAFIPNNTKVGKGVFIGPNATLTDDRHPKAGMPYTPKPPILEDGCSLGAGCVILPGVTIGAGATVGAGAVVTQDVLPYTTVVGIPARTTSHNLLKEKS